MGRVLSAISFFPRGGSAHAARGLARELPRHGWSVRLVPGSRRDPGADADAERWRERMIGWARRCSRLLVAPGSVDRATDLLGVARERIVALPNGFDPALFHPRRIDRLAHWRRHLVEEPRGWAPGQAAGSVAYSERDLAPFGDGIVLVYVGRFTEVKRLPLLIRAYAQAQPRF